MPREQGDIRFVAFQEVPAPSSTSPRGCWCLWKGGDGAGWEWQVVFPQPGPGCADRWREIVTSLLLSSSPLGTPYKTEKGRFWCFFKGKVEASRFPPSLAVWCQAQGGTRSYGPVFEEQPSHTLFPEGSAEEKVILGCRARANPPATYR